METNNKYGLSKKTNVAIAAIGALSIGAGHPLKQAWLAISAITIIALTCVCIQGFLDYRKGETNA